MPGNTGPNPTLWWKPPSRGGPGSPRAAGVARSLSGSTSCTASAAASKITRGRALAGSSSGVAVPRATTIQRGRALAGSSSGAAATAGAIRRARTLRGATSATTATTGQLARVRALNVNPDLGPVTVQVVDQGGGLMADLGLPAVPFRSNESRALYHRLLVNGAIQDLTGWTIELWANGVLLKSITSSSNAATTGLIQAPTTAGLYFFTLLAADVVTLLGGAAAINVPCRVRYVTPDTTPPRVFSNVVFPLLLTTP